MNIKTPLYRLMAVALFGWLLFKIDATIVHTVTDNRCDKGDSEACQVAKGWGYEKPKLNKDGSPSNPDYCNSNMGCHRLPGGYCMCG